MSGASGWIWADPPLPPLTLGVRVDAQPWIPPGYIIAVDRQGKVVAVIRTGEAKP